MVDKPIAGGAATSVARTAAERQPDDPVAAEVSGKLFRFLSAMHPSLSRAERQSFAEYDADSWYPWDDGTARRFNDLMRGAPRDSSFARGFAYVAQKAIPDGRYLAVGELLDHLDRLPSAYRDEYGSGFEVRVEEPFKAVVNYFGMPGFNNCCIAVAGELAQRLQASGGRGVRVRHLEGCRLRDEDRCHFEVTWKSEASPRGAELVSVSAVLGEEAQEASVAQAGADLRGSAADRDLDFLEGGTTRAAEAEVGLQEQAPREALLSAQQTEAVRAAAARAAAPRAAIARVDESGEGGPAKAVPATSGDDLFGMLKQRLEVADRQAALYEQARSEIDSLRSELHRVGDEHRRAVKEAEQRVSETRVHLEALKDNIRKLVSEH